MGRIRDPVVDQQLMTRGARRGAEARRLQLVQQGPGPPARAGRIGIIGVVDADQQVHIGQRGPAGHGLITRSVTSRTH